jgi:hypothetical protein
LPPVGFANSGGLVFVDESAEQIPAAEVGGRVGQRRFVAVRWQKVKRAVWPMFVVVAAVDAEYLFEVAAAEDQDPVEAVGAECANPALGEGVRIRRLNRCADHFDAFSAEDLVEGVVELRVAIVDEEPEWLVVAKLNDEVACLLTGPASVWIGGAGDVLDPPGREGR